MAKESQDDRDRRHGRDEDRPERMGVAAERRLGVTPAAARRGNPRGAFGEEGPRSGGSYGDRQGQYGTANASWRAPQPDLDGGMADPRWAIIQHQFYDDWRERQIRALDAEFRLYLAERQQQFDSEFETWRKKRAAATSQAPKGRSDRGGTRRKG